MALTKLYVDTYANQFLAARDKAQVLDVNSIQFNYGDTPTFRIYLFEKLESLANQQAFPYDILLNAGLTLFLYIDDGTVGGTIYTQQISWTPDVGGEFFYADLPLNTLALQTLLGSQTSANAWLKIGYVQDGKITTVISRQISIGVGLPITALVVPAGLTPLSAEVAKTMFYPLQPTNGIPLYVTSNAGKIALIENADLPDGTAEIQQSPVN